ncbi:MAG: hypothetical protein ABIW38_00495 [Ferruginibacter sp.]
MKKINFSLPRFFYLFAIVIASHVLQSSSCSKNEDQSVLTGDYSGGWRVSMYFDNSDETYKFTGYTFTFNNAGQLTATNGSNTVTGTWSTGSSKLNINFGTTPVFTKLNDDWQIEEKTASSIKLKDDNPSRMDKLQFTKL